MYVEKNYYAVVELIERDPCKTKDLVKISKQQNNEDSHQKFLLRLNDDPF